MNVRSHDILCVQGCDRRDGLILTIRAVLSDVKFRAKFFLGTVTSILSAYSDYFIRPSVCTLE